MNTSDQGVTLLEVILTVFLSSILTLGIAKTFDASVASISHSQSTSLVSSGVSILDATFTKDVEQSNGFIIPTAAGASSITGVSGDGVTVTYTHSGTNTLTVGQNISISGLVPSGYDVSNATITSVPSATTFTILNSTTGIASGVGSFLTQCSTWLPSDSTYSFVRPIVTFSQQSGATITSAIGTGVIATYTYSGQIAFAPGQSITVSGMVPTTYNSIGAIVIATNPGNKTFTLNNFGTGVTTSPGILVYNKFVGYEVRSVGSSYGQLWRIQCAAPQIAITSATSQMLRNNLALSNSNVDWSTALKCATFVASVVSSGTCPTNTFLNVAATNPGLTFTVPATIGSSANQYPTQVILAARSIS